MKRFQCYMEIEDNGIVTIRGRHNNILAMFRHEMASFSTMTRVDKDEDCDNYWIAIKPGDNEVFYGKLFDRRSRLEITNIEYKITRV